MSSDAQTAIDTLVTRFYALFTNTHGQVPRVAQVAELFIPEGLIVKSAGDAIEAYDLDAFVKPRLEILTDGTLQDFSEWETDAQTQIFGAIAHRISHYRKRGVLSGAPFEGSGVKTMLFAKVRGEWKFTSTCWVDF